MASCVAFAPGRTELAGNHVDHQNGVVLTSTLSLGVSGKASSTGGTLIRLESVGYGTVELDLSQEGWMEPCHQEYNTTAGILRGSVAECVQAGIDVSGFDVQVESTLPAGGGLSSSAAFELLLIVVMERLFSDGQIPPLQKALMAQRVECRYFGKSCGIMDQAAIALGGIQLIDFGDSQGQAQAQVEGQPQAQVEGQPRTQGQPQAQALNVDFAQLGYQICLIDVGEDHSVNTEQYDAIPQEMRAVARELGVEVLQQATLEQLLANRQAIRAKVGDRAYLRALHYYSEVRRVKERAGALQAGDMAEYCRITALSGASSAQFLQNVSGYGFQQPAMVALALVDQVLDQVAADTGLPRGVCRIHGGGFGGTLQAYVPMGQVTLFQQNVDALLGAGATKIIELTQEGAWAR